MQHNFWAKLKNWPSRILSHYFQVVRVAEFAPSFPRGPLIRMLFYLLSDWKFEWVDLDYPFPWLPSRVWSLLILNGEFVNDFHFNDGNKLSHCVWQAPAVSLNEGRIELITYERQQKLMELMSFYYLSPSIIVTAFMVRKDTLWAMSM